MNLYFRVILALLMGLFREKICGIAQAGALYMRVLPTDLDMNGHMNNGRYLTIMDIGRMDYILRTGILRLMFRDKLAPVLASATIRYRLPLLPFRRFVLETRVIGWDEKWVFMEQRFIIRDGKKAGAVAAIALLKGGFQDVRTRTMVPMPKILEAVNWPERQSPDMPAHVRKWAEAEEALRTQTAAANPLPPGETPT